MELMTNLCVCQHTDGGAVLLHLCQLCLNLLLAVCVLGHVLGERLLLGLVPELARQLEK
jgi:hypothetical protein